MSRDKHSHTDTTSLTCRVPQFPALPCDEWIVRIPTPILCSSFFCLKTAWMWTTVELDEWMNQWMKEASAWSLNRVQLSRAPGAVRGAERKKKKKNTATSFARIPGGLILLLTAVQKSHFLNKCNWRPLDCSGGKKKGVSLSWASTVKKYEFKEQSRKKSDVYELDYRMPDYRLKKSDTKFKLYLLLELCKIWQYFQKWSCCRWASTLRRFGHLNKGAVAPRFNSPGDSLSHRKMNIKQFRSLMEKRFLSAALF